MTSPKWETNAEAAADECLRAFFRQELSDHASTLGNGRMSDWPHGDVRALSQAPTLPLTPKRTRPLRHSREALAASLLALIAGAALAAYLSGPAAPLPTALPGDVLGPKAEMPGKVRTISPPLRQDSLPQKPRTP